VDKIRKIRETSHTLSKGVSGAGMDRRVEKKTPMGRKIAYGVAGLLVLLFAWWFVDTLLAIKANLGVGESGAGRNGTRARRKAA